MGVALALFIHSPHVNQQVIVVGVKSNGITIRNRDCEL